MKYSLRRSFNSSRQQKQLHDDEHINSRIDSTCRANSNSNLVKSGRPKSFLRRQRNHSSSSSLQQSSQDKNKSKESDQPYSNYNNGYGNDDDEDDIDDPFASSTTNSRLRPFDKITYQIRKSFRNTLTRQRSRLESTNSNKRLLFNKIDENRPTNLINPPLTIGLTSPLNLAIEKQLTEKDKPKPSPKRQKAPLAPVHKDASVSIQNQTSLPLSSTENQEHINISSLNDQQSDSIIETKKQRSFRMRLSYLLKKRHAKKQQKHQQIRNSFDDDIDHQHSNEYDEPNNTKQTFSQRIDTLRRSFHLGNHSSRNKGKRRLLSNE